jgi:hypothetical protein
MMRNKYYFLATDIEIPLPASARIGARWLARDICGKGIGGHTSVPVAIAETASELWWLLGHTPAIAARRRDYRAMLAAASRRVTPG